MATAKPSALGTLPNAPLVLVLAQVRFLPNSQFNLDAMRDLIGTALASRFPSVLPVTAFTVQMNASASGEMIPSGQHSVIGFDLRSDDQKSVLRLSLDSLTLADAAYRSFDEFLETWSKALETLSSIGVKNVQRVGLRYVDFIFPSEGRVPEDYFNPPFDGRNFSPVTGANGMPQMSVHMQEYAFTEGRMRIQYARGLGLPALPAELHGLLDVASIHARADTGDLQTAIFDTDRWIDGVRSAELGHLKDAFTLLHTGVSDAFKELTTTTAIAEWKSPRSEAI